MIYSNKYLGIDIPNKELVFKFSFETLAFHFLLLTLTSSALLLYFFVTNEMYGVKVMKAS